jgi:hypothetical protein
MPGNLWPWVKRASWFELVLFAALCFFWLAPGFKQETLIFGAAHGIGYVALCVLILVAILRRQAPYLLLAASLTPVGPLGSVVAIGWIERRSGREMAAAGLVEAGGPHSPHTPPARR